MTFPRGRRFWVGAATRDGAGRVATAAARPPLGSFPGKEKATPRARRPEQLKSGIPLRTPGAGAPGGGPEREAPPVRFPTVSGGILVANPRSFLSPQPRPRSLLHLEAAIGHA